MEIEERQSESMILRRGIILLLLFTIGIGGCSSFSGQILPQSATATPSAEVNVTSATLAVTAAPAVAQAGVCGRSDQQIILLLGYDARVEYPYGSDGLRLLRADYAYQQIQLLALPRGLWVVAPQALQPTLQAASLGELYQYGLEQGGPDIEEARTTAAHLVAQALYENFALAAGHFMVVEMATFVQVVDSLGGIDITLPETVTLNGRVYNAGPQHWDGATALQFVRELPVENTEWDRFERQDLVLQAIKASAASAEWLTQIPDLLDGFMGGVTTDLSAFDLASFVCLWKQIPEGRVQVESLPEDMVTQGPGVYLMPDYEAISDYLQNWASEE
jgi:anionic cell wall polymer biosynthesis LytR-Cps2A-Psr (LCP) family protein